MNANNPYNPSFGRKPERFLGRELIVNEIRLALDNHNSPWRTTLLIGVRGSGKTALLSDIRESVIREDCVVVSITPDDDILNEILSQLYISIPKSIIKSIPKPSKVNIAGILEFDINDDKPGYLNNFRHQITEILKELQKKKITVLFLIDEAQKHSAGIRTFINTYQHLIREDYDISLIMAGLPKVISDMLNDNILTFLRRANQIILDEVELSLITNDFKEVFHKSFKITDDILEQASMITRGYPYLIQLVGFYLWELLKSGIEPDNILDQIIIRSRSMMFQNVHKLLFRELSPVDKEFVYAMAIDYSISKFADIISRTGKPKNTLTKYRLRLIDSGYIKPVGRGEVAFLLPFTRDFLLQERKIAEF